MKRLLLFLLVLTFTGTLFAKDVQLNDATALAKNAYYQKLNTHVSEISFADVKITEQFTISKNEKETIYAFNFENHGYILIAADDAIEPVLGYSFTSHYNPNKEASNFNGLIAEYGDHINYLRENNIDASNQIAQQWNSLKTFKPEDFVPQKNSKDVSPLLSCTWDQDNPYNYYCPPRSSGIASQGRGLVGCVATAMTQIMKYWRYPYQGTGSNTYFVAGDLQAYVTVDFSEAYYNWEGMQDNIVNLNLEVAELCYHAGVSVNMDYYSAGGSGAYSFNVDDALKDHFGYANNVIWEERSGYPLNTWKSMVKEELEDNCPVYYSGYSNEGGHAFVCDGVNIGDDTYHFNFGWGGYGDGYFPLTNAGGYPTGQQMVHNIMPADANYPYGCDLSGEVTALRGSIIDGSGPQENYDQNANCSYLINPQTENDSVEYITLNFEIVDTDPEDLITIYDGETTDAPVLGTFSGTTPTDIISSTGNKMLITFVADGDAATGTGWHVEYKTEQPSWCSSSPTVYTDPVGTINDGSGDFWYNANTQCMYKVEPEYAIGATLTFTEFDIENEADVLKVYDGGSNQLLAELTGNEIPEPFFVESGKFFLLFTANGAGNGPGWTADWEAGNVGINSTNNLQRVSIFPNPTNGELNITMNATKEETFTVKLLSITGKVIHEEIVSDFIGEYKNTLDVSDIAKGIYFLNINGTTGNINKKVMVK